MSVSDKKRGPGIPEDTGKKRMDSTVICVVGLVLHETHKKNLVEIHGIKLNRSNGKEPYGISSQTQGISIFSIVQWYKPFMTPMTQTITPPFLSFLPCHHSLYLLHRLSYLNPPAESGDPSSS